MTARKPSLITLSSIGLATGSTVLTWHPVIPVLHRLFEQTLHQLAAWPVWNYLVILFAVILEGPLATLLGGVWVAMGRVNFWGVLAISMLAGLLADSFWYYLGFIGRERVIDRWGSRFRLDEEAITQMEARLFGGDSLRVLFVAKLTSALIIPALVAAGMTDLGWWRTLRTLLPAQLLWSAGLTMLGFAMADSYVRLSRQIASLGWYVSIGAGSVFVVYVVLRWRAPLERYLRRVVASIR